MVAWTSVTAMEKEKVEKLEIYVSGQKPQYLLTDGQDMGDENPEQSSTVPRSLVESLLIKLKLKVCWF